MSLRLLGTCASSVLANASRPSAVCTRASVVWNAVCTMSAVPSAETSRRFGATTMLLKPDCLRKSTTACACSGVGECCARNCSVGIVRCVAFGCVAAWMKLLSSDGVAQLQRDFDVDRLRERHHAVDGVAAAAIAWRASRWSPWRRRAVRSVPDPAPASAMPPNTITAAADNAVCRKIFRDLCITDSLNRCMFVDRRKDPHRDS